jgi:hypothetical protein
MHEPNPIAVVYLFTNGMTAVFDRGGQQLPEYQGRQREVLGRLLAEAPPEAEFLWCAFRDWEHPVKRAQVESFWEMWQGESSG